MHAPALKLALDTSARCLRRPKVAAVVIWLPLAMFVACVIADGWAPAHRFPSFDLSGGIPALVHNLVLAVAASVHRHPRLLYAAAGLSVPIREYLSLLRQTMTRGFYRSADDCRG